MKLGIVAERWEEKSFWNEMRRVLQLRHKPASEMAPSIGVVLGKN